MPLCSSCPLLSSNHQNWEQPRKRTTVTKFAFVIVSYLNNTLQPQGYFLLLPKVEVKNLTHPGSHVSCQLFDHADTDDHLFSMNAMRESASPAQKKLSPQVLVPVLHLDCFCGLVPLWMLLSSRLLSCLLPSGHVSVGRCFSYCMQTLTSQLILGRAGKQVTCLVAALILQR